MQLVKGSLKVATTFREGAKQFGKSVLSVVNDSY